MNKNVQKWIEKLNRDDPEEVNKAVQVLGNKKAAEAAAPIINALKRHGEEIDFACLDALIKIGKPGVPALLDALNSKNIAAICCAAGALGILKEEGALPRLVELASHRRGRVRMEAISALENIGDVKALPLIVKALADPDSWVREVAEDAVSSSFAKEKVISAAIAVLEGGSARECKRAVELLECNPESSIGPLIEKYGEAIGKDLKMRRKAAKPKRDGIVLKRRR